MQYKIKFRELNLTKQYINPTEKIVGQKKLTEYNEEVEGLAADEAVVISVIFVPEMLVEGCHQLVTFVLRVLHHLAALVLGQMLH